MLKRLIWSAEACFSFGIGLRARATHRFTSLLANAPEPDLSSTEASFATVRSRHPITKLKQASALQTLIMLAIAAAILLSPPAPDTSVTFAAVGDVMLARGIGKRITENSTKWPFAHVRDKLRAADLTFCNLEFPFTHDGLKVNKPFCFKGDPANVACLTDAGFDIVSLANNHTLDCGRDGLTDTMRTLDAASVAYAGAGPTEADARAPRILTVNGLRIAILARNAWLPEIVWYRTDAPTIAPLDPDTIEDEIRAAARQADVVIVSVHWGEEFAKHPCPDQIDLAHKMIDAGANLVIGHHTHTLQPIEEYHKGVIAYSLGNFVFDNSRPVCLDSRIFTCRLSRSGVSDVKLIPTHLDHWRPALWHDLWHDPWHDQ